MEQDYNFSRYVGYSRTIFPWEKELFSSKTVALISREVTRELKGVHPSGRDIVVADNRIYEVLNSIFEEWYPAALGSGRSQYIIPPARPIDASHEVVKRTINMIVKQVTLTYNVIRQNNSLTKWTTVLGDFNAENLRSHPPLKMRRKRPNPMEFNMNY